VNTFCHFLEVINLILNKQPFLKKGLIFSNFYVGWLD
jgi:hypothetical protein